MTRPTILAPCAQPLSGKERQEFCLNAKDTYTVESGTAADSTVGMIRFYKGMHLDINSLGIAWEQLAAATTTVDVGWAYDDNTTHADDPNGFFDGLDATAAGVDTDMLDTGKAFSLLENGAPEDGYITVTIRDAATDVEGDVTVSAGVSYGNPPQASTEFLS